MLGKVHAGSDARRIGLKSVLIFGLAATLVSCAGEPPASASGPALVDISGIEPLQQQFNADKESLRIVLLLSPT